MKSALLNAWTKTIYTYKEFFNDLKSSSSVEYYHLEAGAELEPVAELHPALVVEAVRVLDDVADEGGVDAAAGGRRAERVRVGASPRGGPEREK